MEFPICELAAYLPLSSASFALRSGYAYMLLVEPFSGSCVNDLV